MRVSKKMTQDDVAMELSVSRTTVSMWENGSALPRADKLPQLAKIFGCTIDELFKCFEKGE